MKRFLIFTFLGPLIALLAYVGPEVVSRGFPPHEGLLRNLVLFAYLIALIPAWLAAGVDWGLRRKSPYLRLVVTVAATIVTAVIWARFIEFPLRGAWRILGPAFVGAIPAVACSLLSTIAHRGKQSA